MRKFALMGAMMLGLMGCDNYDPGGDVQTYINTAHASRSAPMTPIPRDCVSACNTKLAGNYCIRRGGKFGVHATRWSDPDGRIVPLQHNMVRNFVPACFRRLADQRNAWASLRITDISAADVIAACPTLAVCAR